MNTILLKDITLCQPRKTLPVSLSGRKCSFACQHCNSLYLNNMKDTAVSEMLLKNNYYKSILISGGYKINAEIPIIENRFFIDLVVKNGYKINVHPGLAETEAIKYLSFINPVISFDFLTDEKTIENIYRPKGIINSGKIKKVLDEFLKNNLNVVPHIILGINYGNISGEYEAIEYISRLNLPNLVFLVFNPTKNTPFEFAPEPEPSEIEKILFYARNLMPDTSFMLGCMRPRGKNRQKTEEIALKYGFNKIVMASEYTENLLLENNVKIIHSEECCVF